MASVDKDEITIEFKIDRHPLNKLARAQAVENCVQFSNAKPSLGPRMIGSIFAFLSASLPVTFFPS